jgi:hypothetical protein
MELSINKLVFFLSLFLFVQSYKAVTPPLPLLLLLALPYEPYRLAPVATGE